MTGYLARPGLLRKDKMFKIREIVVDGSVEVTNRYLSLEFKDRGQAISYIEELQARYFTKAGMRNGIIGGQETTALFRFIGGQ